MSTRHPTVPDHGVLVDGASRADVIARNRWRLRMRWLGGAVPVAVFVAALLILRRELSAEQLSSALQSARGIPARAFGAALAVTAVSYLVLSLYDFLALRYVGKRVSSALTLLTSFVAYAFAHSLSLASLTGAAIRYRFYAKQGLTVADVARVTAFSSLTLGIGIVLVAGLSLSVAPAPAAAALGLREAWLSALGVAMVAGVAAYVMVASGRDRVLRVRAWSLRAPGRRLAFMQVALGVVDMSLASAVLWSFLPADANVNFVSFAGVYAVATAIGVLSHVPGGIGVFESVVFLMLPQVPAHALAASLLAYRFVYYLFPLAIAGAFLAAREIAAQRSRLALMKRAIEIYLGSIVPQLATAVVLLAAVVLLISGATPGIDSRIAAIKHALPLPVLEFSHLAGSAIGTALLILARALYRRVRAAYDITFWLLVAGIAASLLKGGDIGAALLLTGVLAFLYLGRAAFYRSSSLLYERFSAGWTVSVAAVLILVTCVGFFTYREIAYSNDLWWRFAVDAEASRMLRGSLVTAIVAGTLLLSNLLGPPRARLTAGGAFDAADVRGALELATASLSQAVLAGDKRVLASDSGSAFIMYQIARRSWVALGDPVGRRSDHEALVWRFRELSDRNGGRTVFYQVSGERLPLYVDLGLTAMKLGEEARVMLATFSLEGSARAQLRQTRRRVVRGGITFEIVPPASSGPLLPSLRAISDAWLADKATAEKRFSVGSFSEEYASQFPIALVRRAGTPVAFANLWATLSRDELSVDLMRFVPDAPSGTMDFLFVELMLWGKEQGYDWFNLGMAPLSGLGTHPLAPLWHRVGNFVYRHGEHFYNFEGLRHYKEKFTPVWEPRYLVAPDGLAMPRVVTDISILIAGGLKELITK